MFQLPTDPMLLLSVVNTKLRDYYEDIDVFCEDMSIEKDDLIRRLAAVDYEYDPQTNQFV